WLVRATPHSGPLQTTCLIVSHSTPAILARPFFRLSTRNVSRATRNRKPNRISHLRRAARLRPALWHSACNLVAPPWTPPHKPIASPRPRHPPTSFALSFGALLRRPTRTSFW